MPDQQSSSAPEEAFHPAFVIAWAFCLVFYFGQYALRSAPGVMVPELTRAFSLSALGVSSLVGLYYYTYSLFSLVAGASLDRYGAKYVVPLGIAMLAGGAALFGVGTTGAAESGRLLQGAGGAFAFTGAVYLATHGFPSRYLATAVGFTQCFGMLGGSVGQFLVAPLIHGHIGWQQFWIDSGIASIVVAAVMLLTTPREHSHGRGGSALRAMMLPYRTVLTNPQSYLCGFAAGLLFLPTTIGDMIWGVAFLRDGWHIDYVHAVDRASMVPLGWVLGCPALGYVADHIGRRKPVLIAGALVMLVSEAAILYLPPNSMPPYVAGLALGFGSGAAMIPYTIIKEVNPDEVKGSATGAINFLVFTFSALMAPAYGWLLTRLSGGATLSLAVFQKAGLVGIASVVIAMGLALFIRETGSAVRRPAQPATPVSPSTLAEHRT